MDWVPFHFNEAEAGWAYQAYQVAQAEPVQIGSQPAYVLLTSSIFFFFSSSEAFARLLPALIGSMVVVLPFALKEKIGKQAALIAAFGLALDPLMVAVSRQAGSPMLAVGFAALAVAAWQLAKPAAVGIFAALFLLSGQTAVVAILSVCLVLVLLLVFGIKPTLVFGEQADNRTVLIAGGLTLLLVGSLGMRYPSGLSAMLQAVPDYFSGWMVAPGFWGQTPWLRAVLAFPIYQPLALLFGLIAIIQRKTWQQPTNRLLALVTIFLFALVISNPSRQISELTWVVVPIWLLAAQTLTGYLTPLKARFQTVILSQAITTLILLSFWWANLVKISRSFYINIPEGFRFRDFNSLDFGTRDYLGRMVVIVIIPFVIALMAAIVATYWSKLTALRGAVLGGGSFLFFYLIVVLFGINDLRPQQANELWNPALSLGYADDLRDALAELSEPMTGNRSDLEVVYQLDSPLLHWQLRDMPNARYLPELPPSESPAVIINTTYTLDELGRSSAYRGEKIALQLVRSWGGRAFPSDFDRWFIYREAPLEKQWVVLWAREDIFVGFQELPDEADTEGIEPVE